MNIFKALVAFIILCSLAACQQDPAFGCADTMFGIPVSNTGIDDTRCTAVCGCKKFVSKVYTPIELGKLKTYYLNTPYEQITSNPYDVPVPEKTGQVCAVVIDDMATRSYHLESFISEEQALKEGAILTHVDACGVCSTLEDLAVYAGNLDVGADVRKCGIQTLGQPVEVLIDCIQDIGFTLPCAQIWAYNTVNTRDNCFSLCINDNTYNKPDGTLSDCLACDEEKSGPHFKALAGRTRRNTGIASSICRFCEEVAVIKHLYP